MKGKLTIYQDTSVHALNTIRWRIVVDRGPEIRSRRLYVSTYLAEQAAHRWARQLGIEFKEIKTPRHLPYYGSR